VVAFWTRTVITSIPVGACSWDARLSRKTSSNSFAENKGLKLRIGVASLKFPNAGHGRRGWHHGVPAPDGTVPSRARYTNFFTKKNGQWLLASVSEAAYVQPSNYGNLRELERVIGEWVDENPGGELGLIHLVARSKLHHLHPLG
jgi:hypothetical protein